jgi:hypothetical protein
LGYPSSSRPLAIASPELRRRVRLHHLDPVLDLGRCWLDSSRIGSYARNFVVCVRGTTKNGAKKNEAKQCEMVKGISQLVPKSLDQGSEPSELLHIPDVPTPAGSLLE